MGVRASWAVASCLLAGAGAAAAAEQATNRVVEEVIVTAQKRAESAQDVPVTLSAYSEDFLEKQKIDDLKGLVDFTPGLAGRSKDSFVDTISVRGISTNDFGVGGDPSIGVYKDGVYQGRTGGAVTSFFDIERAEVLRGPQGFLFGRNAASGAIHVITVKPNDDAVEAVVHAGLGERNRMEVDGAINVPGGGGWALRLAGYHSEEDGFVENVFASGIDDLIWYKKDAVRASLGYDNDGRTTGHLILEYEDREQSGTIYRALGTAANEDEVSSDLLDDDKDEGEVASATGEVNIEFDDFTFTSITGLRTHNYTYLEDFDGSPVLANHYFQDQEQDYVSQELRLVSDDVDRLRWFAGVSWYWEQIDASFYQQADEELMCETFIGTDCTTYFADELGEVWPGPSPDALLEPNDIEGEYTGWAVYGDLTYGVTDALDVSLGLRYTRDTKDFEMFIPEPASPLGAFFTFGYFTDTPVDDEETWDDLSPRIAATWTVTDEVMLWASITKGYKAGGFGSFNLDLPAGFIPDGSVVPVGARPQDFDPEIVWSYEAGAKTSLMDGRLILNGNAYFYDYEDLQLTYFDEDLFNTLVENIGKVEGMGVEVEVQAVLGERLDLYVGTALSNTDIKEGSDLVCETDCEGNMLPFSPEFTFASVLSYHQPIGANEIFVTGELHHQGEFEADLDNTSIIREDAYTITNFRVGMRAQSGRWEVSAYLENAFDEFYYDGAHSGEDPIPFATFGPARPRTFGVDVFMTF